MRFTNLRRRSSLLSLTRLALLATAAAAALACAVTSDDPCAGQACNSSIPKGEIHGVRADGRVDVTAAQAWPGRNPEPTPLTRGEIAQACARIAGCQTPTDHTPSAKEDEDLAWATALCATPDDTEERVIPLAESNERWSYLLRESLVAKSCADVSALKTKRPSAIDCQEDGCWWSSNTPIPKVSCAGDVATMISAGTTFVRDCSHSYAHCSTSSPTGCTDRGPVGCDPAGLDRCDGDIKLGCDHTGRVSFHDCGLIGQKCVEDAGGAHCAAPETGGCSVGAGCDGATLSMCVMGSKVNVDCSALGFSACKAGHCAP